MNTVASNYYSIPDSLALRILEFFRASSIAQKQNIDFWTTLSMAQKEEIQLGIAEMANGESVEYETFMQKFR